MPPSRSCPYFPLPRAGGPGPVLFSAIGRAHFDTMSFILFTISGRPPTRDPPDGLGLVGGGPALFSFIIA